jgi:integrase
MAFTEVPRFMAELRERDLISARALEFCILTAARTGEVIRARWDEITGDVWAVPASRTKSGKEHKVPLSRRAAELLDDLRSRRDGDYVFRGLRPGAPLNVVAMLELLRRMKGGGLTVHGFRSAFKDWAHERTSYPDEISEFALAHGIPDKTKAAYRRYTALDKRRRLMQAWSDYCSAPVIEGEVVSLHG